jgi:hypothetical protein
MRRAAKPIQTQKGPSKRSGQRQTLFASGHVWHAIIMTCCPSSGDLLESLWFHSWYFNQRWENCKLNKRFSYHLRQSAIESDWERETRFDMRQWVLKENVGFLNSVFFWHVFCIFCEYSSKKKVLHSSVFFNSDAIDDCCFLLSLSLSFFLFFVDLFFHYWPNIFKRIEVQWYWWPLHLGKRSSIHGKWWFVRMKFFHLFLLWSWIDTEELTHRGFWKLQLGDGNPVPLQICFCGECNVRQNNIMHEDKISK